MSPRDAARAFACSETLGIGIPNPRGVFRFVIPSDWTPEQRAKLEAWIDETNAKLAAEDAAQAEED